MVIYEIIDFKGFVHWIRKENGTYAVDPLFLEEFKEYKNIR